MMILTKYKIQINKITVIVIVWMIIGVFITLYDYFLINSEVSLGSATYYSFSFSLFINVGAGFTSGLIFGSILVFYVDRRFRERPYWVTTLFVAFLFVIIFIFIVSIVGIFFIPMVTGRSILEVANRGDLMLFILDKGHYKNALVWGLVVALTQFTLQINDKFGQGVMWNIIRGRYQKPRHENRIFMFVDLISSTTIAEKLGNEKYHLLLRDFFGDITDAIVYNKGEIYQYIGDEIVISWKMESGITDNRCLRCFFDMRKTIFGMKDKYESKYGLVPDFKAGVHFGSVIAGEIGIIKRDITYSGDVMNTTSRIQSMCNNYNVKILCSDLLLELLTLTGQFIRTPLGDIELKGKENRVALSTLEYV